VSDGPRNHMTMRMTTTEACTWLHQTLIIHDIGTDELVAAFTVLSGRVPDATSARTGCSDAAAKSSRR